MKTYLKDNSQEIFRPERLIFQNPPETSKPGAEKQEEKEEKPKTEKEIQTESVKQQAELKEEVKKTKEQPPAPEKNEPKPGESKTPEKKTEQVAGEESAVNVAPPAAPSLTSEQKAAAEGLDEFKKTWLGGIVGLFGGEKAESDLKEAYAGKGFWGFIGTLLGMTAISKGIETLAEKNPKAKQFLDQGKGFLKGFLDKLGFGGWIPTEISKDSFEKAVQNTVGEAAMDSNYKFSETAAVPSGAELVLMKNEKKPMSITAGSNMRVIAGEGAMDLNKGDSIASDKFDIKLPAGTEIPAGTQFSEGFKIVVAPRQTVAAEAADTAPAAKEAMPQAAGPEVPEKPDVS